MLSQQLRQLSAESMSSREDLRMKAGRWHQAVGWWSPLSKNHARNPMSWKRFWGNSVIWKRSNWVVSCWWKLKEVGPPIRDAKPFHASRYDFHGKECFFRNFTRGRQPDDRVLLVEGRRALKRFRKRISMRWSMIKYWLETGQYLFHLEYGFG